MNIPTSKSTKIGPLDHDSYIPLYIQAETILRELIQEQEYQDGKLLPDEMSLAGMMGISRNTVRQAMDRIVNDGLLSRKKGVGTRVSVRTVTTDLDHWHSFTHEMTGQGIPIENLKTTVEWELAPDSVVTFLGIPENRPVLKVDRLRRLDRAGLVYFSSWLHPRLNLSGTEDFANIPLYDILEKECRTVPELSEEEIRARGAETAEAKLLKIRPGAHVLLRTRRVYDEANRPIEYNTGVYDAELFSYRIKIKRPR
ncbi:MAG: GntR family transcriptional regulator [Balneolaceae bacterium]|nr:MAG: GntR family transcriptional regulator [Balneolaceae bacterium]